MLFRMPLWEKSMQLLVSVDGILTVTNWEYVKWIFCIYCRVLYLAVAVAILVFLIMDIGRDIKRLTSCGGMAAFILLSFLTSTKPARVSTRKVAWKRCFGLHFHPKSRWSGFRGNSFCWWTIFTSLSIIITISVLTGIDDRQSVCLH